MLGWHEGSLQLARHLGEDALLAAVSAISTAASHCLSESPLQHYRCLGRPGGARLPASGTLNGTQGPVSAGPPSRGPGRHTLTAPPPNALHCPTPP